MSTTTYALSINILRRTDCKARTIALSNGNKHRTDIHKGPMIGPTASIDRAIQPIEHKIFNAASAPIIVASTTRTTPLL